MNSKNTQASMHPSFNRGGVRKDRCFKVYLMTPDEATEEDMIKYIAEAVRGWKGGLHPEHPMYELDRQSVKVTRATKKNYGER